MLSQPHLSLAPAPATGAPGGRGDAKAGLCDEAFLARAFGDNAEAIFDELAWSGLRRPFDGRALQAAAVRLREIGLRYGPQVEREATAFLLEVAMGSRQVGPAGR